MQPNNQSRPVMDVTAPPRPAAPPAANRPSIALPVREAPSRRPEEAETSTSPQPSETSQTPPPPGQPAPVTDTSAPALAATDLSPAPSPPKPVSDKPSAPVGAIVAAIFCMLVLAGAAVLVYLNS